jgi:hypothetical protein
MENLLLVRARGAALDSNDADLKNPTRLAFDTAISGQHLDVVRYLGTHDGVDPRFALLAAIEIDDLDLVKSITRGHGEGRARSHALGHGPGALRSCS